MSGIGATDPTGYNYAAADTLKQRVDTLASQLEGQAGSRSSLVTKALDEFRGYFSEVFQSNAELSSKSCEELVASLRSLSGFVTELKEAAEAEDQRREEARAWEQRQRERAESSWEGFKYEAGTFLNLIEEDQPPRSGEPAPHLTSDPVTVKVREVTAPVGGATTSSAVPADLRSFQTGIRDLDDDLAQPVSYFESALSAYEAYCNGRWGTLSAQQLVIALKEWLVGNEQDSEWASEVAGAFEAAGGSGVITVADASITAALASAGVDAQRDDFTIGPLAAVGTAPTNGFADDPVNTATGNFLEPETDLSFAGAAGSLEFTRMYNTLDGRTGVFGLGWSSIVDIRLELGDEGASFVMADGRTIDFARSGTGWHRGVGENYWLTEMDARSFAQAEFPTGSHRLLVVTDNAGGWWAFTPAGSWLGSGAGPGTVVTVARDEAGHITRLRHEHGRHIDIEYAKDRVVSVHASDGRRVEYLYDEQRRLIGVTEPVGTRTYRWNETGLIDKVTAADGVVECENFYDDQRRVIRQLTPYGRSVRFAYLRGRVTSVSTDDGTGANTWIADRKGRVVGIIDAEGNRQSMAYDSHGNIVSVTDRDGQVTVNAYDDRGRIVRTVTPEGADITYGYDDHDRVTTVVTASGGVVEYHYADAIDRNPSVIVDPVGGRTELAWDNGLLQRIVDPEGVTLAFTYDTYGDLIGVTNAVGDTARMVRDHAGRVIEAISPLGTTARFGYDQTGLLVSRETSDGGIWRYEHGPGGKTTAVIDPSGARTEFEYGVHGELTATTDALGRRATRDFDEFGHVSRVGLPDGAQWGLTHDALSRLREITDPAGSVWSFQYDVNGQLAATVDPTGVRADATHNPTENIWTVTSAFEQTVIDADEYGRPTRLTQTDGSQQLVTYDACSRPVELVDADGGLTILRRSLAGRIIAITTPAERTTLYEYDACGRPAVAIDPDGGRTVLTYDADSRVIKRANPAGEITTLDYDAAGRVIHEHTPGGLSARYQYDKLGRLTAVQDSRYGQRRFRYDAAGQLIQATNGLGGVTRYEYDARGRMTNMIDPAGGVTTRTYTPLDQIVSSTDPLERSTTATYDAAGRLLTQTDPDGNVTEWTYGTSGRMTGLKVNGRWIAQMTGDIQTRTTTILDATRDDAEVIHRLTHNRLGQLVQRETSIDGDLHTTRWEYDPDGLRTALITAVGASTQYQRDPLGRITQITHPTLGEVHLTYDAAGRLLETRAGDQTQTWEYEAGFPIVHTRIDAAGVDVTRIIRDHQGRIIQLQSSEGTTVYRYDDACQLISATGPAGRHTWSYDVAGRLISQTIDDGQRTLAYDVAGQLTSLTHDDGSVVEYDYDRQGRRIRAITTDHTTEYSWSAHGWLTGIAERFSDADDRVTDLWVNALGELAAVNDTTLTWDPTAGLPQLLSIDDTAVFQGQAGFTGVGNQWQTPVWRHARATDQHDPWQVLENAQQAELQLPTGVGLTADGGLHIAGLEWMGARVYDAVSHGFLSVDPIAPPAGVTWSASPYSYAGNDPLHAVDPHGLKPISDAELQAYADGFQGPMARAAGKVGDWWDENWEYVAAGALVAGGVAVMATGFGGPLGAAMISGALTSGGLSAGMQKYSNGSVDWIAAGQEALLGGLMGGMGAGASNLTKSFLLQKSSSAKAALDTYRGVESVSKAGTGLWSKLNGTTKLAAATKIEAGTSFNMLVDNFTRGVAADTVSTMTTTNASYMADVMFNDDKDFDFTEFVAKNGSGVFDATVSATFKFGTGGVSMPVDLTTESPISDKVGRFTREFVTGAATDSAATFVDWQITKGLEDDVSAEDRVEDVIDSGASNLGSGLHKSFPNIHIGGGN